MKTARNHSESRRIDLYPQTKICPECHQPFKEKYHKQRWIVKLSGELKVVSHCLGCQNRECTHFIAVYRPEEEHILALNRLLENKRKERNSNNYTITRARRSGRIIESREIGYIVGARAAEVNPAAGECN